MTASERPSLVWLRGGMVVPIAAFDLVIDLEARGFKLWVESGDVVIEGRGITDAIRADLRRHKRHVVMMIQYVADAIAVSARFSMHDGRGIEIAGARDPDNRVVGKFLHAQVIDTRGAAGCRRNL